MNAPLRDAEHYFQRSQQPLASLIFLLPFLLIYEVGVAWYAAGSAGAARHILARSLLQKLLNAFGAGGVYLPGVAVVVVLLSLHVFRRDRWRFEPGLYLGMTVESMVLAVPLLVLAMLWGAHRAQAMAGGGPAGGGEWVFDIGAGIYEELFFRLMVIALAHLVLVDLLKLERQVGAFLSVVLSAGLFSAYHFFGVDVQGQANPLTLPRVVFYFMAGVYFAVVYLLRGFGIVAATHAFYDIDITLIKLGLLGSAAGAAH